MTVLLERPNSRLCFYPLYKKQNYHYLSRNIQVAARKDFCEIKLGLSPRKRDELHVDIMYMGDSL